MLRNVTTYHKPTTVEEAIALVQSNPHAAYLAGGSWVVAQGDPTLEILVDLQQAGIGKIEGELNGVRIGAMATLQQIIDHDDAGMLAGGVLAKAASYTQSRNLREQGTLGGTLIVAGPADPLTTVLLVLDAEISYADSTIHVAPFGSFVAYRDRLLKTRALLTGITVKRPPARATAAFEVVGRSPKDKPIVCVAAYIAVEEGLPVEIRLAVGGADPQPVRLLKTEHILKGQGQVLSAERIDAALEASVAVLNPVADFRGSAEYRREMAKVLSRRALLDAWDRARKSKE